MIDRPMPLTRDGRARLEAELAHLINERRPEVAERIRQSKELSSAQNNAEYEDAKNEQALVEGRIRTLTKMLESAYVIDEESARHSDCVRLGSQVTVIGPGDRAREFTIVGAAEANPTSGRISNESPVGRALLGKRVGDAVQVMAPAGLVNFRVTAIH